MKTKFILIGLLVALFLLFGCPGGERNNPFIKVEELEVCKLEGKPIVRMYGTSNCPHCTWAAPAFDEVAQKYVDQNKIVAYHWNLDTGDNLLTTEKETVVPELEEGVFRTFSQDGYVPAYVIGCKYYRVGNGFENQKTSEELAKEKAEFERIIELVLSEN